MTALEKQGKPTIGLVNRDFQEDFKAAAADKGMPSVRYVVSNVTAWSKDIKEIQEEITEKQIDEIINALTQPLSEEERAPKSQPPKKVDRIVFKGTIQEVNQFFYMNGWTEGGAIIPPTEEAVKEMLAGTDLPPDHVIAEIVPDLGKATVEKIAINAVMTGCLPTHLPVLIAGVEAVTNPRAMLNRFGVSANSWAPLWVINGPIRNDININYSTGALSPGRMANAVIGRAMRLIILNCGGARQGIEDMGTLGIPAKYCMLTGEYEEASPWSPLHVERGFKLEDSTITVCNTPAFRRPMGEYRGYTDGRELLGRLVDGLRSPDMAQLCIPEISEQGIYVFLGPQAAQILAKGGWNKNNLRKYIGEYARLPAKRLGPFGGPASVLWPKELLPAHEEWECPVIPFYDQIQFVVMGTKGSTLMALAGPGFGGSVTQKIELPKDWKELVKKYAEYEIKIPK